MLPHINSSETPFRYVGQDWGGITVLTNLHNFADRVYLGSGYAAAVCIFLIFATTMVQMVTRYLGINMNGLSSYAGYFMAASTFLGLSYALMNGAHIRIETISKLLGPKRVYLDLFAFGAGTLIAIWFARYACSMVYTTLMLNDVSTDMDATPLWIPQATMAVGILLFALAMIDNFLTLLFTGEYRMQRSNQPV